VPLSELLTTLEREADQSAAEEMKLARVEAERLLRVATTEATASVQERVAEHTRALRGRAEERLVEARRKAETRVLEARRELLDRVFAGALALQAEVRGWPSYRVALECDVRRLLALTPGERVTLLCPSADRSSVLAAAGDSAGVEASPEMTAGVRLRSADGRLEADCSLSARLAAARPTLAISVLQQLETAR
jgi:vacuolar-type H+-ATPase subunit E/Vma4